MLDILRISLYVKLPIDHGFGNYALSPAYPLRLRTNWELINKIKQNAFTELQN